MTPDKRAQYDDLVEIAARRIALGDGSREVDELIADAVDLRDGWRTFDMAARPGTSDLPVVDEVIDAVLGRAGQLRRQWAARLAAGPLQ